MYFKRQYNIDKFCNIFNLNEDNPIILNLEKGTLMKQLNIVEKINKN